MNQTLARRPDDSERIRVIVVDDSAVIRGLISRMLEGDPRVEVVATCANGQAAVQQSARLAPDVVVLDIEMPVMDGLTALPLILQAHPSISVIMASTLTQRNAEISMKALALGAEKAKEGGESAGWLAPTAVGQFDTSGAAAAAAAAAVGANEEFRRELLGRVLALGTRTRGIELRSTPGAARIRTASSSVAAPALRPSAVRPEIVAIGSSTGGPQALFTLTKALPRDLGVPVVITQHMPRTFTAILAENIARTSGWAAQEATEGARLLPGHMYVAPGDRHLQLQRDGTGVVCRIIDTPPENFCRPSVDPMFRSVAQVYGARALCVMLTGMGQDGLRGSREIVAAGATLIAQDEATSVVWGMPRAVAEAGLCAAVLPLPEIAPYVTRTVSGARK